METSTTYSLRKDLEFSSQQHLGKNYIVVKDPLTKRYFRFTENQKVLLDILAEPSSATIVAENASIRFGSSVSMATIESFIKSLEEKLLLDTDLVREQLDSYKGQKLESRNILYWKVMSLNAEPVFRWLVPRTRWAFTKGFHIFAISVIFSALILNFIHLGELTGKVQELFNLHGLFLVGLVIMCVVTMHEFAHGLTCCQFGGKVQEVGFMLIYFQPAFYCDVSDSWMFPSKKQRMLVTLAGGYFQLTIWGICTWLWRITDTDTVINHLALVVIVFAGLQTLVNFNPLIKLDGYYMLSDYLEIPNLRQKAVKTLWNKIAGRKNARLSQREERAQVVYGAASIVFSTTLLIYVYRALYTWATSHYAFAGLVGFLMFSTFTLRRTAVDYFAGVQAAFSRAAVRKFRNGGIVLIALLVAFVGHWELKIPAESRVLPRNEMTVRPETSGVIVEMLVHEGSHVAEGDVIARLRDFDKQQRISDLKGQLDQKTNELALLRAGARQEEIDRKEKLVETKKMQLSNARRNQEQRNELEQSLQRSQSELQLEQQTLKRTQELWDNGLVARADLEKAQTAVVVRQREIGEIEASIRALTESSDREFDLKTRELAEAESDLRLTLVGNRPEQIREVEAEVHKLHGQVDLLEQELQKTDVRAPIEGVVSTPFVERKLNQSLAAGDELCRLVDISRVTVEMEVPEKEMADVHPGNPVMVLPRSFPMLDLKGRVDFIAPVVHTVNGQQVVVVRSELPNEDLTLKPDMTGISIIYCGDRRIIDLMSRRLVRWIRTELWALLP